MKKEKEIVEIKVYKLFFDKIYNMPILIMDIMDKSNKTIPIYVGIYEATIISAGMKNSITYPIIYDLCKDIINKFDAEIKCIVINDFKDSTYYANIEIEKKDGSILRVDARPGDAIAIAVHIKVPIFINREILNNDNITVDKKLLPQSIHNINNEDEDDNNVEMDDKNLKDFFTKKGSYEA